MYQIWLVELVEVPDLVGIIGCSARSIWYRWLKYQIWLVELVEVPDMVGNLLPLSATGVRAARGPQLCLQDRSDCCGSGDRSGHDCVPCQNSTQLVTVVAKTVRIW